MGFNIGLVGVGKSPTDFSKPDDRAKDSDRLTDRVANRIVIRVAERQVAEGNVGVPKVSELDATQREVGVDAKSPTDFAKLDNRAKDGDRLTDRVVNSIVIYFVNYIADRQVAEGNVSVPKVREPNAT